MDASWEHHLVTIRKFGEEAGERATEIEERLSTLNSVRGHLKEIESQMARQPEQDRQKTAAVKAVCDKVLFSDYVYVTHFTAAITMVSCKIQEEEANIPASMQPKVKEIKGYFAKIKERKEKIDYLIKKIIKKIDEAEEKDFKITQTETARFEMLILDLEEGLKICADYLSQADKVLKMLSSDITTYFKTYCALAFVGTTLVVAGTAGAAGAVGLAAGATEATATTAAASAGALVGVPLALYNIYSLYCEYDSLTTKNEKMRSELRILEIGLKEQTRKATTVKEKKKIIDNINSSVE